MDCFSDLSNGTAVSANNLYHTLKKKGHIVRVIAPYISGEGMYCLKERYIPLVTEVSHKQHMHFGKPESKILKEAFSGADIIHFFLPFKLEIVGVKIAKEMKIPYIGAFHLQPEHITYNAYMKWIPYIHEFLFWLFKFRFYKHIRHIHCPSKMIENELVAHKFSAKLFAISNGFNASFHTRKKQKRDELFHIVMTGRYAFEKRQDLLINAIKLSKYESRIKLHLKGLGPREEYLRDLAKTLSNEVDFGFVGKDELAKLYDEIDIYVHTADVDGEAISALEAIACGIVPIISDSKLSATKQFALDERSLFKAGDSKDLAKKIDYFIENHHILDELGKQYADSAKQYDLDLCVDKMLNLYSKAIADFKAFK